VDNLSQKECNSENGGGTAPESIRPGQKPLRRSAETHTLSRLMQETFLFIAVSPIHTFL
jgi:hypothetical protein